jgi:hypothetical protein
MKKFLSVALALAMTLSLVVVGASATEYKDLTDKASIQHSEAVSVMNKIGIISGYSDGTPSSPPQASPAARLQRSCLLCKAGRHRKHSVQRDGSL